MNAARLRRNQKSKKVRFTAEAQSAQCTEIYHFKLSPQRPQRLRGEQSESFAVYPPAVILARWSYTVKASCLQALF